MRYGMPYQGSKNAIARDIINQLPSAPVLIDAFAGGCAITHAALEAGRWERVVANDISGSADAFARVCREGVKFDVLTREEFENTDDLIMRLVYSFGNSRDAYLWARDIEPIKVAASRLVIGETLRERYLAYRKLISAMATYLQGLEGLERLQTSALDYTQIQIPDNAVLYCDPPYKNTFGYGTEFDFDQFDNWARTQTVPTFISEYRQIDGFTVIWQKQKPQLAGNGTQTNHATELLMVNNKWAHKYGDNTLF